MSKQIRIYEADYKRLTDMMRPRESYADVVQRIMIMFDKMGELRDVLEGAARFKQEQHEALKDQTPPQ